MSETPTPYGDQKSKYPPANKTPNDGTYTFYVFKLNDWSVGKTAKGNGYVKVDLSASCGARVKAKFFCTDKAAKRTVDFIKACSGVTVTPAEIADETTLAAAISELCCGKKVQADIKRGKDNEFNGQSYPSYEVSNFASPAPF